MNCRATKLLLVLSPLVQLRLFIASNKHVMHVYYFFWLYRWHTISIALASEWGAKKISSFWERRKLNAAAASRVQTTNTLTYLRSCVTGFRWDSTYTYILEGETGSSFFIFFFFFFLKYFKPQSKQQTQRNGKKLSQLDFSRVLAFVVAAAPVLFKK